jgi:hypothetical protein
MDPRLELGKVHGDGTMKSLLVLHGLTEVKKNGITIDSAVSRTGADARLRRRSWFEPQEFRNAVQRACGESESLSDNGDGERYHTFW